MNIDSNSENLNEKNLEDNKICIVCLDNEYDIENNKLIEYNHCGIYYVHNSCLNAWTHSECLICREKMYLMQDNNQSEIITQSNVSNISNSNSNSPLVLISTIPEPYDITRQNKCNICFYKIIIGIHMVGILTMLVWTYFF